ncbi:hypothetical protein [Desulfoluna spongiiphila]|uniref:hypothetical protein n=1 Tax=Desulfoluna spongiiphila TaxID=419481 RepID=UPI001256C148|nr:hypothetical protein [Desulfoluna spongiiphila]VVS91654.1 hypothetical protein DBB_12220 [Desulfoluna spongiiphila]
MEHVKGKTLALRTLLTLQTTYGVMALSFLFVSGWYARTTGKALSAQIILFLDLFLH